MGFQSLAVAALLLLSLLVATPSGSAELALGLVVALAVLVVLTGSVDVGRGMMCVLGSGPSDEERTLRGSFRRQQRPDEAGRPMPRAPGALAGAF